MDIVRTEIASTQTYTLHINPRPGCTATKARQLTVAIEKVKANVQGKLLNGMLGPVDHRYPFCFNCEVRGTLDTHKREVHGNV